MPSLSRGAPWVRAQPVMWATVHLSFRYCWQSKSDVPQASLVLSQVLCSDVIWHMIQGELMNQKL